METIVFPSANKDIIRRIPIETEEDIHSSFSTACVSHQCSVGSIQNSVKQKVTKKCTTLLPEHKFLF